MKGPKALGIILVNSFTNFTLKPRHLSGYMQKKTKKNPDDGLWKVRKRSGYQKTWKDLDKII